MRNRHRHASPTSANRAGTGILLLLLALVPPAALGAQVERDGVAGATIAAVGDRNEGDGVRIAPASHGLHTELEDSRPPADSVVEDVREVLLDFTTPVDADLSRIVVLGEDGFPVEASDVAHPEPEASDLLVVRFFEALPAGEYEVRWSTVSPDGHPISDDFVFHVAGDPTAETGGPAGGAAREEGGAPGQEPPQAEREAGPDEPRATGENGDLVPAGTAERWVHLLATILLIGVAMFRFAVLPAAARGGGFEAVNERAHRGLRRFGWIGTLLLAVTLFTRPWQQLGALGVDQSPAWDLLPHLLFRTAWGGGWWLHLAIVVLAAIGLVVSRRPGAEGRGWGILAGAALLLPLVPAFQGHAMGSDLRVATIPVLFVHVGAASAWLGGLVMLLAVGLPAVRKLPASPGGKPPLARLVEAFSRRAMVAVAIFVATGVANVVLYDVGVGDLVGEAWGRTLILKVVLVAAALLLGYHNWRRVRPTLAANPDPGALRIPASVEAFVGILVLLVTAALVLTPLP